MCYNTQYSFSGKNTQDKRELKTIFQVNGTLFQKQGSKE